MADSRVLLSGAVNGADRNAVVGWATFVLVIAATAGLIVGLAVYIAIAVFHAPPGAAAACSVLGGPIGVVASRVRRERQVA